MSQATRILLRLDVGADEAGQQRFEAAWTALATAASRELRHLGDTLCRDLEMAGRYWITTDWQELADFQRFSKSSAHENFRAQIQGLVTDRSVHRGELVGAATERRES